MSVYAQEYGYFFNSNSSDRTYNADSFETWLRPFFVSGVFTNCLQVLAQDTPDMTVKVTSGYANLDGKAAYWPDTNTMTLEAASGVYDRIDTIVLRRDNTNRRVSIEVVKGTASATPVPTAPERTSDIFELVLAEILVGTGVTEITQSVITDTRPDTDVCGYVVAAVQTPDFGELYAQFAAQAEEFMGDQAADFLAWFDEMKDQLSEDAAGHLQLEIDDINDQMGDIPEGQDLQSEIEAAADEVGRISDAMSYVVNGNKSIETVTIPVGAYFRLANSEIVGRSDGMYTAKAAIPVDTVIDSSYFNEASPIAGGGLNALNSKLTYTNGNVTGSTEVTLPDSWEEISIACCGYVNSNPIKYRSDFAGSVHITRYEVDQLLALYGWNDYITFMAVGGYRLMASGQEGYSYRIKFSSATKFNLQYTFGLDGNDYTSGTKVYYSYR